LVRAQQHATPKTPAIHKLPKRCHNISSDGTEERNATMEIITLEMALVITAVFLFAGTIKGAIGIGLPTISISIMAQFLDPRLAISLVLIPVIVSNFWQFSKAEKRGQLVANYWIFAACLCFFLLVVSAFALKTSTDTLLLILGIAVVIFTVVTLMGQPPTIPKGYDRLAQIVGGTAGGILGGLTAIWSPPMLIYFLARRIPRDEFIGATGFLLFLGGIPLAFNYWRGGILEGQLMLLSIAMIAPTLLGFTLGAVIRKRLDAEKFQKIVLIFFLLMGLNLIRRAVMG
jgi:hypothetical protein